jgi:hypothetical protein
MMAAVSFASLTSDVVVTILSRAAWALPLAAMIFFAHTPRQVKSL